MEFKRISVSELQDMLKTSNVNLVDIRDPSAYEAGHLDNAVSLDNSTVDEFVENTDKSQALVIYCYHGFSSQSAAGFFCEKGFEEVYSLDGGYEGWQATNS